VKPEIIEPEKELAEIQSPDNTTENLFVKDPGPSGHPVGEGVYHIVQAGETLYSISRKYGVTVDDIKVRNKLSDNTLSINQRLLIR
jgi:LysM repeat protein